MDVGDIYLAAKGLQPYEIVRRTGRRPAEQADDVPRLLDRRPHENTPPRLTLTVTPLGTFAAAALAVSALALAFTIGRLVPLAARDTTQAVPDSLEEVYRRGPINYFDLEVDRGTPD